MQEVFSVPDVFGLPIYRVNRCIKQVNGNEIHILMGQEVCGQIVWSHVEVWTVADVLRHSEEFNTLARSAIVGDCLRRH